MISIHCVSMALKFLSPISMSDPDLQCVVASDDEMYWFRVISSFAEAARQEPADWAALRPDLAWRLVVKNQGAKLHGRDWHSMKAHSAGFELDAGCTASSASPTIATSSVRPPPSVVTRARLRRSRTLPRLKVPGGQRNSGSTLAVHEASLQRVWLRRLQQLRLRAIRNGPLPDLPTVPGPDGDLLSVGGGACLAQARILSYLSHSKPYCLIRRSWRSTVARIQFSPLSVRSGSSTIDSDCLLFLRILHSRQYENVSCYSGPRLRH